MVQMISDPMMPIGMLTAGFSIPTRRRNRFEADT